MAVPRDRFLARLGPAVVVQGQTGVLLVHHVLQGLEQARAARLVRERHRPGANPPVESPVPLREERGRPRHRLRRRVARQGPRRGLIGHALAQDHPDTRVLVGLQARVRELGAAGIEEAHRSVPDQLDQAEQRGVVLLVLGHRGLKIEDVHERARLLVGEDAAHRVRVADVHVAVEEARGDHEVAAVDHPVGARVGELGRLPHPADAPVLHQHRAVLDDAALPIEGQDVAGAVDLETLRWHGGGLPGCLPERPMNARSLRRRPAGCPSRDRPVLWSSACRSPTSRWPCW